MNGAANGEWGDAGDPNFYNEWANDKGDATRAPEPAVKRYVLGNWLRGTYEGEFSSVEEAWLWLSHRFLLSYPSSSGRMVYMKVHEVNAYGLLQYVLCKEGYTSLAQAASKEEVLACCKSSVIVV